MLAEDGSLLEGINLSVGVYTALKTIAGVGAQSVTAGTLANPCWMEVGTLQHHTLGGVVGSRTLTAKDTCDTHRLLGVADAQVVLAQGMLLTVEGHKLGSLWLGAYHDLMSCHHVGIKAVQWLSVSHHDIVGDVHDVVDRTQADDVQLVLQPLRTLLHLAVGDAHTGIALAGFGVLNLHLDRQVLVVDNELIARRTMHTGLISVLLQPRIEVACHSPVTQGISSVGCDVYLDEPVALQVIILCCWLTYGSILWQHDDAVVRGSYSYLVLGTDHAETLHAAKLAALDGETLVAVVEHAAQVGYDDFLSCCHVGGTAYNLLGLALAQIYSSDMEVIAIGMHLACQHFTYVKTLQSTLDGLYFFQSIDFETARSQRVRCLLGSKVEIDVFFKPFV